MRDALTMPTVVEVLDGDTYSRQPWTDDEAARNFIRELLKELEKRNPEPGCEWSHRQEFMRVADRGIGFVMDTMPIEMAADVVRHGLLNGFFLVGRWMPRYHEFCRNHQNLLTRDGGRVQHL